MMPPARLFLAFLTASCAFNAAAQQVYHWIDDNGVPVYSQRPPPSGVPVDVLHLDVREPDPDAGEDIYDVAAQQQRMEALREELVRQRERRRERAPARQPDAAEPPQAIVYPNWYAPLRPRPPRPPRPPAEPEPPTPAPDGTDTLKPPNGGRS